MSVLEDLGRLADAVLAKHATYGPAGAYDADLWAAMSDAGLTLISVPEEAGGSGGSLQEAAVVLEAVGRRSAQVPLAETTWLAAWLLDLCGAPVPSGPMSVSMETAGGITGQSGAGARLSGHLRRCEWARDASHLVVLFPDSGSARVSMVPTRLLRLTQAVNLAQEPVDDVLLDDILIEADHSWSVPAEILTEYGQRARVARSVRAAGAARAVLDMALDHVATRKQFGKALREFQAVQQMVARLAGLASMMNVTSFAAVEALVNGTAADRRLAASSAASISSECAGQVASLGHQLLGAMGTTQEHDLHRSTTRLWAWREAYGNETTNARDVGMTLLDDSAEEPWSIITGLMA